MGGVTKAVSNVAGNIPIVGGLVKQTLGVLNGDTANAKFADGSNTSLVMNNAQNQQAALAAAIAAQQNNPVSAQTVTSDNLAGLGANRTISQQQNATDLLNAAATGQTPSVAQAQLQQNTDRAISQGMAQAAAARGNGGNSGLLAQNVARASASNLANANQAASQLRAQEIASNLSNYANQANSQRGQDLTQASTQAQQNLTASQANAANNLNAQQLQNNQINDLYGLSNQALGTQSNAALGVLGAQQGAVNQATESNNKLLGGVFNGIGSVIASDKRLKKDIKPADNKIDSFLKSIKAEEYSYKDSANGKGKFVSPMAQDLEKTDIGKSMVLDTPQGKMVDYRRGLGAMLAAQASINDRLGAMEKAMAMKTKRKS